MLQICLPVKQLFTRGAADLGKVWRPGEEITISFLGGSDFQHESVKKYAILWLEYANLSFAFISSHGKVRIGFTPGSSWSHIGTDALDIKGKPTMNLGWIAADMSVPEIKRVILHEFGHMLGLEHEHQSPEAAIPWDKEKVYAWARGAPNYWGKNEVESNFFSPLDGERIAATNFDPKSIMLYPVSSELTGGRMSIDWNDDLSELDKEIALTLYPKG